MIWRMALFGAALLLVVGLTHTYLYRRLVRDPWPEQRRGGRWLLLSLALSMMGGIGLARALPRTQGVWAGYLAYGWMGMVVLLVTLLAALDVVRLASRPLLGNAPSDPDRRLALARGAAAVGLLGSGGAGAMSVREALAPPELVTVEVPIAGLPPALRGFRIVQISDLHVGPTIGRDFVEAVVERARALEPDLVVVTGDLVDGSVPRLWPHVEPLGRLTARHGVLFVTGNHEYYSGVEAWLEAVTKLGMRPLRNERVTLSHDGARLDVLGVDDWRAKRLAPGHGHDLARAAAGRDPSHPAVLLAHQPKVVHEAAELGLDLVLCGHTHGGQIWPFGHFVRLIQPYVAGLHRHGPRTWIHVSRGTGYWGPPMRLKAPGELTLVRLV